MSNADKKKVSIVVPFLDEKENLPVVYDRVVKVMEREPEEWELLFVDDGSTDGSAEWVAEKAGQDSRVKMIRLSRNFGHQIAITAGLDYVDAGAAVIMDGDLQDPPEVIADLLAKWREGFQVVYAVRRTREGETWLKKTLAAGFYKVFRSLVALDVPLNAGDFRLVDHEVIKAMKKIRELHRFMRGLTSWVGYRQGAVYYDRAPRLAGTSKYPVWKSLRLAWDAVTSFSGIPLRWITGTGFAFAILGCFVFVWVIILRLVHPAGHTPGWATLLAVVLLLGGVQLFSLGMIGQYVSRLFEESKHRPLYLVRQTVGSLPRDE